MVKSLFKDLPFKERYSLGAVNSINWARVLAQVVYYFYAYFRVAPDTSTPVVFSVPTGNFGDIFAGYVAKRMGLPVEKLLLATNENNILTRFVTAGDYSLADVVPTVSPSMDIQVASNFERYIYYLFNEDAARVRDVFASLGSKGRIDFTPAEIEQVRQEFASYSVDRSATLEIIGRFQRETGYLLDPHSAVGVGAALNYQTKTPVICLATAHPAKFPEAVREAIGTDPPMPASLQGIDKLPTRYEVMKADLGKVKAFIEEKVII